MEAPHAVSEATQLREALILSHLRAFQNWQGAVKHLVFASTHEPPDACTATTRWAAPHRPPQTLSVGMNTDVYAFSLILKRHVLRCLVEVAEWQCGKVVPELVVMVTPKPQQH